ncbi:MAG: CARDB domain-containing protein, partial [Bryobacteraceae bacterium]
MLYFPRTIPAIVGVLLASGIYAQPRDAFQAKPGAPPVPESMWERGVKRVRAVEISPGLFAPAAAKRLLAARKANRLAEAGGLEMNFFDGKSLPVRWTAVEQSADWKSRVWTGVVEGAAQGHAVLIVNDGMMTGNFSRGDGTMYQLRPGEDGTHWVREVDQSQFSDELHPLRDSGPVLAGDGTVPPQAGDAAADDGSVVDVMVLYTQAARVKAGGAQAMQQLVNLGIAETNQGYANSGVIQRVRLVYTAEVNYQESATDMGTDLGRLATPDDGYLDEVHRLRDNYNADLVSLWVEGGDACGIAYLLSDVNRPLPTRGFSVVGRSCATGYYSFGHELGHNMGATHGRDDNTGAGVFPYSYAFKRTTGDKFRTIMGYDNNCSCPRVNCWSNPGVAVKGVAAGVDPNTTNGTANYLTLNNTRNVIANYRTATPAGGGGVPPAGNGLPESDHPYANGADLTWTYTLPGTAASLNVTFDSRTAVEAGYDFIYIYDRNNTQIAGSPFTGASLAGKTVTVPGTVVKIRLTSDEDTVDFGFRVASVTGNGIGAGATLPRLAVTIFTTPATGAVGQRLAGVRTTVANQGTGAASAFRLGFYFSRTRTVTAADVFSGWSCSYDGGVAVNATTTCNGELGVPTTLTPGTWFVAAIADDLNQVQQSDRSGNIRVADAAVTITGGTPAEITAPAPGSVLSSGTVTFRWSAGVGVSGYTLTIGTTAGGTNLYNRDQGGGLSVTVSGLPVNGSALHVTLISRIGTTSPSNRYTYSAASLGTAGNLAKLAVTSFSISTAGVPGGKLSDMTLGVANQGSGATGAFRVGFYLSRNAAVTAADLFTGWSCSYPEGLTAGQSTDCAGEVGLPTTLAPGAWYMAAIADDQNRVQQSDKSGNVRVNANGQIAIAGIGAAEIVSPVAGTTLTSSIAAFRWNTGSGAEQYALTIGTLAAGDDLFSRDMGTSLTVNVPNLPVNGRTLYVRLFSRFGADWYSNDYTYRAYNAPASGTSPKLVVTSFLAPVGGIIGANLPGTSLSVTNQGNANAGPFRIGYYFSKNRAVTVNDVFSGWSCTVSQGL